MINMKIKMVMMLKMNYNTPKENNIIQKQFEFLFSEGLLKNRINTLNLKLQSFLFIIINDNFLTKEIMSKIK